MRHHQDEVVAVPPVQHAFEDGVLELGPEPVVRRIDGHRLATRVGPHLGPRRCKRSERLRRIEIM